MVVHSHVGAIIKIPHFGKNRQISIPDVEVPMDTNIKAMVGREPLGIDRSEKRTETNTAIWSLNWLKVLRRIGPAGVKLPGDVEPNERW